MSYECEKAVCSSTSAGLLIICPVLLRDCPTPYAGKACAVVCPRGHIGYAATRSVKGSYAVYYRAHEIMNRTLFVGPQRAQPLKPLNRVPRSQCTTASQNPLDSLVVSKAPSAHESFGGQGNQLSLGRQEDVVVKCTCGLSRSRI